MAREPHAQRREAIEAIRSLCDEHGVKEGCRQARDQFPDIPRPTWGRWRVEAIGYQPEQEARDNAVRAKVSHEVRQTIPDVVELVPAPADVISAQRRAIDFWRLIEELDEDAALMRDYATTVTPEGKRRVRIPMALMGAHKMRSDLIRLALEHASIAYGVERVRQFQDAVVSCIGEISPDMQRAVIERLRRLQEDNVRKYGV